MFKSIQTLKLTTVFLIFNSIILIISGCAGSSQETVMFGEKSYNYLEEHPQDVLVSANQHGYYPESPKYVITEGIAGNTFLINNAKDDSTVFSGELRFLDNYDGEERFLKFGDFSSFKKTGEYCISFPEQEKSISFTISESVYSQALKDSLKSFYFQRASAEISEEFGGKWARKMGHPDDRVIFHETSGRTGTTSSPGGWYDAGDYGKYIVNGGISVATLLYLYELFPDAVGDNLNIPESGNGISDLLDEVKYELDWFKTMQDDDGGVFFKLAGLTWPGFILPDKDRMERYIFGKSTTSTLNFSAVMAQAGRVFMPILPVFASDCLERAGKAFSWALENWDVPHPNEYSGSGGYGDSKFSDEFVWACAELYVTTGENLYKQYLDGDKKIGNGKIDLGSYFTDPVINEPASWPNLTNFAFFSLAAVKNGFGKEKLDRIRSALISFADEVTTYQKTNPYKSPMKLKDFIWGSNGVVCNYGMNLGFAWKLTGDRNYLDGVLSIINYTFGQNATGYSFVTGYGEKSTRNLHSRLMGGDKVKDPIPGFIAGGPNQRHEDNLFYNQTLPEKMYLDNQASYASNENCINWNAPLVFILGLTEQSIR